MWRVTFRIILVLLIATGCRSGAIEEVVNDFPDIHNLEALDKFSKDVQDGTETEVKIHFFWDRGARKG